MHADCSDQVTAMNYNSAYIDFAESFQRHLDDADHLREHKRWPNADQLYGFAAECGIKAVMLSLGMMRLRNDGIPEERKYKVHIHKLWDKFRTFASGRSASRYASLLPEKNPFDDWDVTQRYFRSDWLDAKRVDKHHRGALAAKSLVKLARSEGRLV